ncbi:hypothetical protein M422DRAFT_271283, partial [Sphaerobolus stellatus SS14]
MDDNLEQPTFPHPKFVDAEDEGGESDEDDGPDWTKFKPQTSSTTVKPALPKRGDKEFEPASNGPTNLQQFSLTRSRDAMFGALSAERDISNKSVSYAIWHPDLARASLTQMRGVLFGGIGHSVPRSIQTEDGTTKMQRRTELLPEETLYLIERGSLFCWMETPAVPTQAGEDQGTDNHAMQGAPMSVQQAYAEMIGS